MIVYITNTDDVFFISLPLLSLSVALFSTVCLFFFLLLLLLRFAIVPICQLLLFTEWFWFILFPRYFTFRFPIGYFSGILPLIFSLFSFLFQCLLGWILFVLSMYIRIFAYFFRVFTFLHVYRLMFRVHYSFFCSFNGGKVLFFVVIFWVFVKRDSWLK